MCIYVPNVPMWLIF